MIHEICGTYIPNSECTYDVVGNTAKIYGHCPCGQQTSRGYLGRIKLTQEQINANYHDMPLDYFRLVKVVNHSSWRAA